nr:hypothetical protein [Tanacetum cinerariifolium]
MEAQSFKDLIIQNMDSNEKCIVDRALHEQEIYKRLNDRKLKIQECKEHNESCRCGNDKNISRNKMNSSGNESGCYGKESSSSGNVSNQSRLETSNSKNDTNADAIDITPFYDIRPMVMVPYTAEYNVFAVETQHTEQPKNINDTSLMKKVDSNTTPDSSDICNNKFQADHNADGNEDGRIVLTTLIANLKLDINENKKNQKQLRKANTTLTHELNECKYAFKESNDIGDRCIIALHDQEIELEKYKTNIDEQTELKCLYLEKIEECECLANKALNTKASVQHSARLPNTTNGSKQKPRNSNQQPRIWPPSMSSCVSNRDVNMAESPKNSTPFLNSKNLACPTCKKSIYTTNHDVCIFKYLFKVNYCVSAQKKDAQSHKTTKRYILVEKKSDYKKPGRQIPIGQRFSPNKSSNVYVKTTPPRFGLTRKPMSKILTYAGLRWIPTRNFVKTCIYTNDSVLPLGKEICTPNTVICANSSSFSAGTSMASEPISSKGSTNVYIIPSFTLV